MYFPASGVTVTPWVPVLVAFVISFFASMGGISGAFLILPFQMSVLGYTHPSVSATNQLFNIVAIPSGVYRYWREKRMLWPLAWIIIAGTLPGVLLGAFIRIHSFSDPRRFKLFAAAVLFYLGTKMLLDLLRQRKDPTQQAAAGKKKIPMAGGLYEMGVRVEEFRLNQFTYTFAGEKYRVPVASVFLLCLIVGMVGGIYGIGGGAIIAPFLITFIRLPAHTIGGATLMGTCVTSIAGVLFYSAIAPLYPNLSVAPDWPLGLLFGFGGMLGMYCGARCQKFIPASLIKYMLTGIIFFTAIKWLLDFLP